MTVDEQATPTHPAGTETAAAAAAAAVRLWRSRPCQQTPPLVYSLLKLLPSVLPSVLTSCFVAPLLPTPSPPPHCHSLCTSPPPPPPTASPILACPQVGAHQPPISQQRLKIDLKQQQQQQQQQWHQQQTVANQLQQNTSAHDTHSHVMLNKFLSVGFTCVLFLPVFCQGSA